jgi:hypothetical protein
VGWWLMVASLSTTRKKKRLAVKCWCWFDFCLKQEWRRSRISTICI